MTVYLMASVLSAIVCALLVMAVSGVPAHAGGLAEDVLSQRDRWNIGQNLHDGDYFMYRICDAGVMSRCYDVNLKFVEYADVSDSRMAWIVHAEIYGRLGYVALDGVDKAIVAGSPRLSTVSGEYKKDMQRMDAVNPNLVPDIQRMVFFVDDTYKFRASATDQHLAYSASLQDTLLLIGSGMRVGDGDRLEHDAVLEVGTTWTRRHDAGDMSVVVMSTISQYEFGNIRYQGDLYKVEYVSKAPIFDFVISEHMPFPLAGTVVADRDVLQDDQNIPYKFWYKLMDTNKAEMHDAAVTSKELGDDDKRLRQNVGINASSMEFKDGFLSSHPVDNTTNTVTVTIPARIDAARIYDLITEFLADILNIPKMPYVR